MIMKRTSGFLSFPPTLLALFALAFAVFPLGAANAHAFVVELRAVGPEREAILTDALRGFLLATAERDGHAAETSNGHLGGLDVFILPQPESVAARFPELKAAPSGRPDIIAVIGANGDVAAEAAMTGDDSVILRPGTLRDDNRWAAADPADGESFAARYTAAFGQPASQWAARGYNAARRIEAAVRPLGGVDDRAALVRALAESAGGIRW